MWNIFIYTNNCSFGEHNVLYITNNELLNDAFYHSKAFLFSLHKYSHKFMKVIHKIKVELLMSHGLF